MCVCESERVCECVCVSLCVHVREMPGFCKLYACVGHFKACNGICKLALPQTLRNTLKQQKHLRDSGWIETTATTTSTTTTTSITSTTRAIAAIALVAVAAAVAGVVASFLKCCCCPCCLCRCCCSRCSSSFRCC